VNERVNDLAHSFHLQQRPLGLVCECGDGTCTQQIRIPAQEYEEVRADPTLFVIFPGHEAPGVERIVDRRNGYDIVRKHEGEPARLAERTDPRA
jgi:hypothetical protein